LENEIKRNPNKLSSGQVKKILLIRAALEKSEIIILDEPAAFLDPTSRLQFFELLKELNNQGVTIFISSHILDEIKKYIDSVTFIKQGEIK
jgi:ABC-2 type transport system ATP-binding protein